MHFKSPVDHLFPKLAELKQANKCPLCNKDIKLTDFRDMLSKKEFTISGLCQTCQNKVFGK